MAKASTKTPPPKSSPTKRPEKVVPTVKAALKLVAPVSGPSFGEGIDALFGDDSIPLARIPLDLIDVSAQIRTDFGDSDETADFNASVAQNGVLQPILLRNQPDGRYGLVAGERRYRAARAAGHADIPALLRTMTDDEAAHFQLQENIHRKNLSLLEEANALKRDLDRLGDQRSVAALHKKSESWVSMRIGMLTLSPVAQSLIDDRVSADVAVISGVAQIEKRSPEKAREVATELNRAKGKTDARKLVEVAKAAVIPPRAKGSQSASTALAKTSKPGSSEPAERGQTIGPPSTVKTGFANDDIDDILEQCFADVTATSGLTPKQCWADLPTSRQQQITASFDRWMAMGKSAMENPTLRPTEQAQITLKSLASGEISLFGHGLFAWLCHLQGLAGNTDASPVDIFALVRKASQRK